MYGVHCTPLIYVNIKICNARIKTYAIKPEITNDACIRGGGDVVTFGATSCMRFLQVAPTVAEDC